jgi:hypothetical protein
VYHPDAGYTVVNALTGKCMHIPGASTGNAVRWLIKTPAQLGF